MAKILCMGSKVNKGIMHDSINNNVSIAMPYESCQIQYTMAISLVSQISFLSFIRSI